MIGIVSPVSVSRTDAETSGCPIRNPPSDDIAKLAPRLSEVCTSWPSIAMGCTSLPDEKPKSPFTAAIAWRRRAMLLVRSRPGITSFDSTT